MSARSRPEGSPGGGGTRSTMAATGILYVDVVAVIIGEVLGGWLSAMVRMPV